MSLCVCEEQLKRGRRREVEEAQEVGSPSTFFSAREEYRICAHKEVDGVAHRGGTRECPLQNLLGGPQRYSETSKRVQKVLRSSYGLPLTLATCAQPEAYHLQIAWISLADFMNCAIGVKREIPFPVQ